MKLLLTCEHGGANIPNRFESYFIKEKATLLTHRGFDIGALDVFKYLKPLADFSNFSETSRLLIELNRSLHHKHVFSEYTKTAPNTTKQRLIDGYYLVYRNTVEHYIKKKIDKDETVLHISVHSFTPILNGIERNTDIGLLYDSSIPEEKFICKQLSSELVKLNPKLNVRYNYPYLGRADGFTTYLRKQFPNNYLGIEIEINQKFASQNAMPTNLKHQIYEALKACLVK